MTFRSFLFFSVLIIGWTTAGLTNALHDGSGAVELPGVLVATQDGARQQALSEGRSWQAFRARYGHWTAVWNEATTSPHLAFGDAIPLDGPTATADQVDRATRRFISGHPELFGSPTLATVRAQRIGQVWYVTYRQTVRGVPVLFEDWEFRVGATGRLMMFGADAHRIEEAPLTQPRLAGTAACQAAHAGLSFDPVTDTVEGGETLWLLPYPNRGSIEYRLVYDVHVTTHDPAHAWIALVDASNGEVLWRRDQAYEAISGHVSGYVQPTLPTDPFVVRPFVHENVMVGGSTVVTDANGAYSATVAGPATVTTGLNGPFANVLVDNAPHASFTASGVPDGSTVDVLWGTSKVGTPSDNSERDVFYHVNRIHDAEKAIDPDLVSIDFPLRVNILSQYCGVALTFLSSPPSVTLAGYDKLSDCTPTAAIPDVIYHEYGHVTNHVLYTSLGAPFGMLNGALHEGTADVLASLVRDDPIIGTDLRGPGIYLRRVNVANRWPEDRNADIHNIGLIIGGAFWELSRAVGVDLALRLYHFAKYGLPDDPNDPGVAMSEYFVQTLVADDDDGNLANGTPHLAAINAAFDAHGIGTGYFVSISHTPLADQPRSGPFSVTATFTFDAASLGFGRLDVMSPSLHYSINGGAFVSQRMTPMASPSQFNGTIPAAPGAVVRYYLDAADMSGGHQSAPFGAPATAYSFLTGTQATLLLADMESNPGWNPSPAKVGKWQRDDPVGTTYYTGDPIQPELDHTPDPGTKCFFTDANGDVGGLTTLITSTFSAAGVTNPVIEYFRWFVWAGETISEDNWRADVSNDGGATWVNVEAFTQSDPSWRRVVFPISSRVTPTNDMKMRFSAEDVGLNTLVEAAVDDFRLLSLTPGAAATATATAATTANETVQSPAPALSLRVAASGPSRRPVLVSYAVPTRAPVNLAIFDLAGRRVRDLESGFADAGDHQATWDGLDEGGSSVSSRSLLPSTRVHGSDPVAHVCAAEVGRKDQARAARESEPPAGGRLGQTAPRRTTVQGDPRGRTWTFLGAGAGTIVAIAPLAQRHHVRGHDRSAAVAAARRYVFRPALRGRKSVAMRMSVGVRFTSH
jgi:hypothetical protein